MKKLIATIDEDFVQIDHLLKELRHRIASAAEAVHVAAEKAAAQAGSARRHKRPTKRR